MKLTGKLDAKTVAALRLDGKDDETFWDGEMEGFGLRLRRNRKSGKVKGTWMVQYRRAGTTRKIPLGEKAIVSPQAARKEAERILAAVKLGHDPQAQRSERRDRDRVQLRSVVEEYLDLVGKKLRRQNFVRQPALPRWQLLQGSAREAARPDHPARCCRPTCFHHTQA